MAYELQKKYPDNFSEDIISTIEDLTLQSGTQPFLQGSGRLKLNYPSDFDLAQYTPVNKNIIPDFKSVINKLLKRKNVYIADIKSGEIPFLKVIPTDTNEINYNERREGFIIKLNELYKNGCIDKEEFNESISILKPDLKNMDISIVKHYIRFEIIRWKPQDILKGFVVYRTHKVPLNKYLFGDNTTKIDTIIWVNGIRYTECSMIYFFLLNGKPTNSMATEYIETIKNEIPYLLYKKRYMKICKRINNLETYSENPNEKILEQFYKLFNSDLSLLNQVLGDIAVLKYLIENINHIPKEKFEFEIDQMKYRLGNMTNSQYLNKEDIVTKLLNELENDVVDISIIDKLETLLRNILEPEVFKIMKKMRLFPIPDKFMPDDFKKNIPMPDEGGIYSDFLFRGGQFKMVGGKLKVKHLKEILNASYSKTPKETIDDFVLDKQLSNSYAKVYHNPKTGQTVIAHKGTQGLLDWGNNIVYGLFGKTGYKLTPRFRNAKKVQEETVKKYGFKELTTVGHSQGGLNAEILGQKGKEVITLNKATRPFANKKGEKQYDVSTTGDVVSKLNPFQGKSKKDISIKSKTYNPITEHVLPVLEGLNEEEELGEGQSIIKMKKKDFIKEHKELIPILEKGTKKQRMKEGMKQEKELKEYMGKGMKGDISAELKRVFDNIIS
jgi:uncharacterized protein YqgQ